MIKVMLGKKGTGKTKILVDTANKVASEDLGDIVFIDYTNQLMYDLKHEIRFINVSDFPINDPSTFLGFICGIISEDYDIKAIFIDAVKCIVKGNTDSLKDFFDKLKGVSDKFSIDFYISINEDSETIPEYLKEFVY